MRNDFTRLTEDEVVCGTIKIFPPTQTYRSGPDIPILLKTEFEVYTRVPLDDNGRFFRPLKQTELDLIIFDKKEIIILGCARIPVKFTAKNNKNFSLAEILKNIEKVEQQTRHKTSWFGASDLHHIFYEGLYKDASEDNVFYTEWGS